MRQDVFLEVKRVSGLACSSGRRDQAATSFGELVQEQPAPAAALALKIAAFLHISARPVVNSPLCPSARPTLRRDFGPVRRR